MMREIKTLTSPDGKRKLHISEREDGFFSFDEAHEVTDDCSDIGLDPITYWSPVFFSGLYESAEAAEREAIALTSWLHSNAG
jgi:hypothetical protein